MSELDTVTGTAEGPCIIRWPYSRTVSEPVLLELIWTRTLVYKRNFRFLLTVCSSSIRHSDRKYLQILNKTK